jgi:hypothetical protein
MSTPLDKNQTSLTGLTVDEVARREGVSGRMVRYWCESGALLTAAKIENEWVINPNYFVKVDRRHLEPLPRERVPGRPRGRPLGVKNSRPYPEGVKRPRRKK